MAELAIPFAILGGMYIMSNQDDKTKNNNYNTNVENFQNSNISGQQRPQTTQIPTNYPTEDRNNGGKQDFAKYNGNTVSAKYFEPNTALNAEQKNNPSTYFTSLTGNVIHSSEMKHNNQVPFFGSRVKQAMDINPEGRMDYMTGSGSSFIRKQEQAPLFRPEKSLQYGNGAPINTDFYQDRTRAVVGQKRSHEKPWEEIRVGPGLGKGAGIEGSGGFNSGMEAREKWIDKNVDQLRIATNPKLVYNGVVLPAKAHNPDRGDIGQVHKQLPDKFYQNGPERYLTTTGVVQGQKRRQDYQASQIMLDENRDTTQTGYYGNTGPSENAGASYAPQNHREPFRQTLDCPLDQVTNRKGFQHPNKGDFGIQGHKDTVLPNNRDINSQRPTELGPAVSNFAKAMIAPFVELLRPTKKTNVIGNARVHGNANGINGNKHGYVLNPADRPRTTIKEQTVHRKDHNFVQQAWTADGGAYVDANPVVYGQQRDTTLCNNPGYVGARPSAGGQTVLYNSAYNQELIDKTPTLAQRAPMGGGPRVLNSNLNPTKMRDESTLRQQQLNPPRLENALPPSAQTFGKVDRRTEYGQDIYAQRLANTDLSAFNKNPYTHSLTGIVGR